MKYERPKIKRDAAKNDVFFSAASYKKDIIFSGHLFSFSAVFRAL
jgi:hypothetical protein